jgi:hypothetical protein
MAIGLSGVDKINNELKNEKSGNDGALDKIRRVNPIEVQN